MARASPEQTAAWAQRLASLILTVSNINWKGFKPVLQRITDVMDKLNLKDYWGRLILVTIAGALIGFVLFDWRRQAVEATEAKAAALVLAAERDTLLLKVAADESASAERQRLLIELAKMNEEKLDAVQEAVDANPDWSNQPLPAELRNRLPNNR